MHSFRSFVTVLCKPVQRGHQVQRLVETPAHIYGSRSTSARYVVFRSGSLSSHYSSEVGNEQSARQPSHTTRVLYDGECKLCKVEISGLKWMARNKTDVEFVDITSPDYDPALFSGVTYEQAMREMHVVGPEGQVYTQGDAIRQMYRASGLGWLASLTEVPGVRSVCDRLYIQFAIYRLRKALARCDSESDRCSIKLHRLREKIGDSL